MARRKAGSIELIMFNKLKRNKSLSSIHSLVNSISNINKHSPLQISSTLLNDQAIEPIQSKEKKDENINKIIINNDPQWLICGKLMQINKSIVEYAAVNCGCCNTIYGQNMALTGINKWKVKILKKSTGCGILIGISSTINHIDNRFYGKGNNRDPYNVAYSTDGYKYSQSFDGNGCLKYGSSFTVGDIISIILDSNRQTVSFKKNNKKLGIAHKNIKIKKYFKPIEYRLAVCMISFYDDTEASIELISFSHKRV